MTNELTHRRRSARSVRVGSLALLLVAAAACSSTDPGPDAEVVAVDGSETLLASDDVQSGDTRIVPDDVANGESGHDFGQRIEPTSSPVNEVLPGFREVRWEDLIPPGLSGEEIFARYEERLEAAEPGSPEIDKLYAQMNAEWDEASVNPQLDSEDIQLAGFVAPLTYDGDVITEFLLVPYFGACIHVPPPPANQTVVVTLDAGDGLSLEDSWGAVWVAGTLIASPSTTDLATAGYSISGAQFGVYETA